MRLTMLQIPTTPILQGVSFAMGPSGKPNRLRPDIRLPVSFDSVRQPHTSVADTEKPEDLFGIAFSLNSKGYHEAKDDGALNRGWYLCKPYLAKMTETDQKEKSKNTEDGAEDNVFYVSAGVYKNLMTGTTIDIKADVQTGNLSYRWGNSHFAFEIARNAIRPEFIQSGLRLKFSPEQLNTYNEIIPPKATPADLILLALHRTAILQHEEINRTIRMKASQLKEHEVAKLISYTKNLKIIGVALITPANDIKTLIYVSERKNSTEPLLLHTDLLRVLAPFDRERSKGVLRVSQDDADDEFSPEEYN